MGKIQGTYINDFGKEYSFEIESGVITHSDMGDDYDNFITLINEYDI